jgi:L-iditol 2-dehydrogenase
VGERVVADPFDACERCQWCQAGRSNLCSDGRFAGFVGTEGALRETMPWPSHLLHALPDGIDLDEAALLETLGVALHALELDRVPDGARVGVYGCGPIGLLLVQLLRRSGASVVVATDRLPHRVAAACSIGATDGFVAPERPTPAGAADPVGGRLQPVDVAFETGGDDALADAIAAVRPGGRVVLVGIPDGDRTTFRAAAARRKELTLQLSRRMLPGDLTRAIDLVASGDIDLTGLITDRLPLADAAEAFAIASSRRGLKVVVNPSPIPRTAG